MRDLSDPRLVPLAAFMAKQRGYFLSELGDRKRNILLDAAEAALQRVDERWECNGPRRPE